MISTAQPDQRRPGWDILIGTVTAVDTGAGTCTVTVRGVSIPDVSYLLPAPTAPPKQVAVQSKGTQYFVLGTFG